MMLPRFVLIFSVACALCGCAWFERPVPKPKLVRLPKAHPLESVPRLVGIVSMVNEDGHFVLVESNQSGLLDAGTALKCFRDGVETGVLAVGSERRRPYVTADIIKGEPKNGDQVFE